MSRTRRQRPSWRPSTRYLAVAVLASTAVVVAPEVMAPASDASAIETYCTLARDLDTLSRPSSGYEMLPNEEQYRIAKQLAGTVKPMVEALHTLADRTVKGDTRLLLTGVELVAQNGDFRILGLRGGQKPEEDRKLGPEAARISAAIERIHDYNVDTCRWRTVSVPAVDHAFDRVPAGMEPGLVSFEFDNHGDQPHELGVHRLLTDAPVAELVAEIAADDALRQKGPSDAPPVDFREGRTEFLGEAFAPAGKSDYLLLDLKPGRYVLVCFVPDGTVYESEEHEYLGGGPAHALSGMIAEFEVRK